MGQDHSAETRQISPEQVSQELAVKFAEECYSQVELRSFKNVFRNLADEESGIKYWSESTLCRFLELPNFLGVGPVVYQMVTYLAAFPFPSQAPSILTKEALLRAVTLLTQRHLPVLKSDHTHKTRLLYESLAVFDTRAMESLTVPLESGEEKVLETTLEDTLKGVSGFAIDKSAEDNFRDEEDDEPLAFAALASLKATEFMGLVKRPNFRRSIIPSDNLLKLIVFLLLLAPLNPKESPSDHAQRLSDDQLKEMRRTANSILSAFGTSSRPGISYESFMTVVSSSLPFMFDSLGTLFERFLSETSIHHSDRKDSDSGPLSSTSQDSPISQNNPVSDTLRSPTPNAPLEAPHFSKSGEVLNPATLSQLSFFIFPPTTLFHRLHPLYSGAENGFSLLSFERSVFNWPSPTILLVSGTLLPSTPTNSRERTFADALPPKRFPSSTSASHVHPVNQSSPKYKTTETTTAAQTVIYGAYIPTPWRHTHKSPFGTPSTLLFQLHPTHDVFRASSLSQDYVSFTTSPFPHAGINFGSAVSHKAGSGMERTVTLGPVSLYLDDALEYGVFTHNAAGGGSFFPSCNPARRASVTPQLAGGGAGGDSAGPAGRRGSGVEIHVSGGAAPLRCDWQDRFAITSLEVYGCGGTEEAESQRKAVEWEEREARLRREGAVGRAGSVDADKEILRMAGLLGAREGGSMG